MAQTDASDTLKDWDFYKKHVEGSVDNEDYIGAHSALIAAGPPELSQAVSSKAQEAQIEGSESNGPTDGLNNTPGDDVDIVYPIGVIQNAQMQQNRGLNRLFEVGSRRSYFIPGRNQGSLRISRVMFHGKSLLRVLTAHYRVHTESGVFAPSMTTSGVGSDSTEENKDYLVNASELPGSNEDFFINLASDLFDRPLGLMVYLKDNNEEPYGQFYLENCFIGNHSFQLGAGSTMISEGVQIQWDNLAPIEITSEDTSSEPPAEDSGAETLLV